MHRCFLFQSLLLLFSHASEVRGKNMSERKFASTGYQTHNHQVMSQTQSPLSYPGWAFGHTGISLSVCVQNVINFSNSSLMLHVLYRNFVHWNQLVCLRANCHKLLQQFFDATCIETLYTGISLSVCAQNVINSSNSSLMLHVLYRNPVHFNQPVCLHANCNKLLQQFFDATCFV